MKRFFSILLLSLCTLYSFAQEDEPKEEKITGFQKDRLFTGGVVTFALYTGGTTLGVSPYFGYSINNWLDAAVSLNFVYQGQTDINNVKYRQTNFGPGAFVRLFPVNFLFVQAQYEHNFISSKFIIPGGSTSKSTNDVNSLLLGLGYSSGRSAANNSFYYLSVMADVLQLPGSPYVDSYGRIIPVIRAGYNIALFQGRQSRNR